MDERVLRFQLEGPAEQPDGLVVRVAGSFQQDRERVGPADLVRRQLLGAAVAGLGLDEEAIGPFEDALRLDPARHADRARLARVLADSGENEEALALLRSALTAQPAAWWSEKARTLQTQLSEAVSRSNAEGKGV